MKPKLQLGSQIHFYCITNRWLSSAGNRILQNFLLTIQRILILKSYRTAVPSTPVAKTTLKEILFHISGRLYGVHGIWLWILFHF